MRRDLPASRNLGQIRRRVDKDPDKVIRRFEGRARRECGVDPGLLWTLMDWATRSKWSPLKSMHRCVVMEIAAYQMLRKGMHAECGAQLVQNMVAQVQNAMNGGDWTQAWLLTVTDPLTRPKFAGFEDEISAVPGRPVAMSERRKKFAQEAPSHGEEKKPTRKGGDG